jgi:hypothetical protein
VDDDETIDNEHTLLRKKTPLTVVERLHLKSRQL